MTNFKTSTYEIPNREWYSLEQAIKRVYKLTGEEISIEDLIHYWGVGKLEIKTSIVITPDILIIGGVKVPAVDIRFMYIDINQDIGNAASSKNLKIFKEDSDTGLFYEVFGLNLISEKLNKNSISELIHERLYVTGEFYIADLFYSSITQDLFSEIEVSMGSHVSIYFLEKKLSNFRW